MPGSKPNASMSGCRTVSASAWLPSGDFEEAQCRRGSDRELRGAGLRAIASAASASLRASAARPMWARDGGADRQRDASKVVRCQCVRRVRWPPRRPPPRRRSRPAIRRRARCARRTSSRRSRRRGPGRAAERRLPRARAVSSSPVHACVIALTAQARNCMGTSASRVLEFEGALQAGLVDAVAARALRKHRHREHLAGQLGHREAARPAPTPRRPDATESSNWPEYISAKDDSSRMRTVRTWSSCGVARVPGRAVRSASHEAVARRSE